MSLHLAPSESSYGRNNPQILHLDLHAAPDQHQHLDITSPLEFIFLGQEHAVSQE